MKAFLAGFGAGMALGILFAPQSGVETREQLLTKADELTDWANQQANRMKNIVSSLRQKNDDLRQKAQEFTETATSQAKDVTQSVASKTGAGVLVRLNTASREDLMSIAGIGPVLADRIIEGRPFITTHQLIDRGIVPESTFQELVREFKAA
jgi:DNA uptake protein ComE-like DNA-binding protein